MSLTQALMVSPLTSISHAPQLPVRQPVGISKPAFFAVANQSSPSRHMFQYYLTFNFDFVSFNLIMMRYLNVYQIHQDYQL